MTSFFLVKNINNTFLLTVLALIAFAANSLLCRMALIDNLIDPISFTIVRLFSGASMLAFLVFLFKEKTSDLSPSTKNRVIPLITTGSWRASATLFIYALCFSVAYVELSTGTGALILFAAVQMTLISISIIKGQRLSIKEWVGVFIAFSGFVYLILPSISSPTLFGLILMTLSGVAWAYYTYLGFSSKNPLTSTFGNFIRTVPFSAALLIYLFTSSSHEFHYQHQGLYLGIISGAITSGLGYFLWYQVLPKFSSTQSGVLQLSVPLIATLGGVMFVNEPLTLSIIISSSLIISGILIVLLYKNKS